MAGRRIRSGAQLKHHPYSDSRTDKPGKQTSAFQKSVEQQETTGTTLKQILQQLNAHSGAGVTSQPKSFMNDDEARKWTEELTRFYDNNDVNGFRQHIVKAMLQNQTMARAFQRGLIFQNFEKHADFLIPLHIFTELGLVSSETDRFEQLWNSPVEFAQHFTKQIREKGCISILGVNYTKGLLVLIKSLLLVMNASLNEDSRQGKVPQFLYPHSVDGKLCFDRYTFSQPQAAKAHYKLCVMIQHLLDNQADEAEAAACECEENHKIFPQQVATHHRIKHTEALDLLRQNFLHCPDSFSTSDIEIFMEGLKII